MKRARPSDAARDSVKTTRSVNASGVTRTRKPSKALAAQLGEGDGAVAKPERAELQPEAFRARLMGWYRAQARVLPWRGTTDPYRIWVSEIMLQQTRVAAVIEHYNEFLRRFPTLVSLALASEPEVLAAWSGLGYYRRARMLHKAAQFIVQESDGKLPATSAELRTLPGIGDYTAAAIASIAFGEEAAVVDGNVERVILRLTGRANEATAAVHVFVRAQAQALMPMRAEAAAEKVAGVKRSGSVWDARARVAIAAGAHPHARAGGESQPHPATNPAGDHNQAMMELGATVCLPRTPLCLQCPVYAMCRTRGEHGTPARARQRSVLAAYLLDLRKQGPATEVLLEWRPADASLMPAMYELPTLPLKAVDGREPVLRVRHSITNTNYYVQVFAPQRNEPGKVPRAGAHPLRRAVPKGSRDLLWVRTSRLAAIPLTGLARKILQRLRVMEKAGMALFE